MRALLLLAALAGAGCVGIGCAPDNDKGEPLGPAMCRDTIGTAVVWVPCPEAPPPDTCFHHHHDDD